MEPTSHDRYIVVFKEHAPQDKIDAYINHVESSGGKVTNKYDSVMKGFAGHIPATSLTSLQSDDLIDYIEPDGIVTTQ